MRPSLLQQMNPHSQHVILKKLNKEKFLASKENDILWGLTQIVSGLIVRGAILLIRFVDNFVEIIWQVCQKQVFRPDMRGWWRNMSLIFSQNSQIFSEFETRQKKVFRPDLRGWWRNMLFTFVSQNQQKNMCTSELAATHSLVSRFNCCLWFLNHHLF